MATTADFMLLQQQLRREMAGSLQRVREEMHTAINGKGGKSDTQSFRELWKLGHVAANCVKGSWNRSLNPAEEDKR